MQPSPAVTILTVEEIHAVLNTILTTLDNNARRNAEVEIAKALRNSQTAVALVGLLRDTVNVSAGARHLCAVLLRKKLFSLWRSLPLEHQHEFKQILLQQLGLEPVRLVRFAIAHVVSVLAKAIARDDDSNGWPELQNAIYSAMQSPQVEMRELSMVLSYSIAEVFGDKPSFINGVGQAIVSGLNDPVTEVRLAAVKAVSVCLPFIHGQKAAKAEMNAAVVPAVIQIVTENATREDMIQLVLRTMELVEQLCEDLHTNSHSNYLTQLSNFLVSLMVTANPQIHLRIREHASEILCLLIETKPKFISKANLLEPIVRSCLEVMAQDGSISLPFQYDEEEEDLDDEDHELLKVRSPCMFAAKLLSMCSQHLPSKKVTDAIMNLVTKIMDNPQASTLHRKSSIIALACLAEGNPGYLRRKISLVLQMVDNLLRDSDPVPREAAAFSLMYFSEHLQPEILTHHQTLLPMLMTMVNDPCDTVRQRVAETLDSLCENVAENLDPYIPQLMPLLLSAIPISSVNTQESLVSALSSIAQTQCPAFGQFSEQILSLLREPMSMETTHPSLLRAKATEAIGIIALAMGRERYQPYFDFFMGKVVENLQSTRAELREQAFGFLANMCELLREDFAPFLNDSVAAALNSITSDNARYENKHLLAQAAQIHLGTDDTADDVEESEEDDDAEEIHMRVRTADVEEKSSAVYAIGVFADVLRVEYFSFEQLQACWKVLTAKTEHFHVNVRSNILETMTKIAIAVQGRTPVQKTASNAVQDTLSPNVREIINELLYEAIYPCLTGETEKEVVAAACDALTKLVEFYGSQFVEDITDLCAVVSTLLKGEAVCQTNDEDMVDSDEDVEDDAEFGVPKLGEDHDHVLMDAVCDIIDTLAAAFGADFEPHFRILAADMLPYLAEGRPSEDFTMAAGVMANCFMSMGPVSAAYFDEAVAIAIRIIYETDESAAKANCCFIIRALIEHCPEKAKNLQEILTALWNVAGSADEIPAAVDNAISATCTVVRKLPQQVPMDSVVPVLLNYIPMRVDKEENKNALMCVGFLLECAPDFVGRYPSNVFECLGKIYLDRSVDNELKQQLAVSIQRFASQNSAVFSAAVAALPNRMRNALAFLQPQ